MRALTIALKYHSMESVDLNIQTALEEAGRHVERAMLHEPDLICLPETFSCPETPVERWFEGRQGLEGTVFTTLSALARKNEVFLICPILLEEGGKVTNSVLLLDRKGEVAARFDKFMPTIGEMALGVSPGAGAVAVDTELGRIGFSICFDLNFDELRLEYKRLKPDLIIFCSMFHGGLMQRWWAFDCRCYFIASTPWERSGIINPLGETIAETSHYYNLACADLNLDYNVVHLDYNSEKFDEIRKKYGPRVCIRVPEQVGTALLQSCDNNLAIEDIVNEFELEPVDDYFDRARRKKAEMTG